MEKSNTTLQQPNPRVADHKIDAMFLNRWSPRAMSGEALTNEELMSLFEAARWASSSFNGQPWRFLYAKRNTKHWDVFFDLLVEFNQQWCKNAAALVVILSRNNFEQNNKPERTHSFDTGAAWMSLALQGSLNSLVVHGMEGFDYEKARKVLDVPNDHTIEAMCAVGKPGRKEDLPKEMQEREVQSARKPAKEFVFEGKFLKKQS